MRYVVTEMWGYNLTLPVCEKKSSGNSREGLAVQVLDTAWNHRVVFSAKSEDYVGGGGRTRVTAFAHVRELAATRCDLLNRLDEIARQAQGAVA